MVIVLKDEDYPHPTWYDEYANKNSIDFKLWLKIDSCLESKMTTINVLQRKYAKKNGKITHNSITQKKNRWLAWLESNLAHDLSQYYIFCCCTLFYITFPCPFGIHFGLLLHFVSTRMQRAFVRAYFYDNRHQRQKLKIELPEWANRKHFNFRKKICIGHAGAQTTNKIWIFMDFNRFANSFLLMFADWNCTGSIYVVLHFNF